MSTFGRFNLPTTATGLRLARITSREELLLCESILFPGGCSAVDTVLRRAQLSGRVETGGEIANHFADVLDAEGSLIETIALDAGSYGALKNKWMRCKADA